MRVSMYSTCRQPRCDGILTADFTPTCDSASMARWLPDRRRRRRRRLACRLARPPGSRSSRTAPRRNAVTAQAPALAAAAVSAPDAAARIARPRVRWTAASASSRWLAAAGRPTRAGRHLGCDLGLARRRRRRGLSRGRGDGHRWRRHFAAARSAGGHRRRRASVRRRRDPASSSSAVCTASPEEWKSRS